MNKKRDSQIIQLSTFKDNSVVYHSTESVTYAPKVLNKMNKKSSISDYPKMSINSRLRSPPKRESAPSIRRDTIKDISKGALHLLKQKSLLLSHIFETEEKKQEITKRIGRRKSLTLGYASGLLLEKNNSKTTGLKLSLSRRKTRLEQFFHTQYLFNCKVQALLAMATICTSIVEYENTVLAVGNEKVIHTFKSYDKEAYAYNINKGYYKRLGRTALICSYISFILSFFLWISIYYDTILFHILKNGTQEKSIKILNNAKKLITFIFNIFIFFFCPNPFTYKIWLNFHSGHYSLDYEVPLNSIFTSICLFRVWFIFKLYLVSSESYSQRSFRIAKINGVNLSLKFPFKANMTDSSLIINFALFLMCWLVCSYDLRIFERYFDELNDSNLGNYLNDLWCVFITMTTVGYGDISPQSFLGRVIIIISCMFGVFLVGLMVVSVTSYLNLVGVESNVYKILLKSEKMEERNKLAYKAIAQYLKSIKEVKEEKNKMNEEVFMKKIVPHQKKQIYNYLKNFKLADLDFLQTIPALNDFDNIGDHLRFLEENMTRNQDKVVEIVDLLDQLNSVFHNV